MTFPFCRRNLRCLGEASEKFCKKLNAKRIDMLCLRNLPLISNGRQWKNRAGEGSCGRGSIVESEYAPLSKPTRETFEEL